uniref:Uncharacterized protein n=1 Tax=Mycena chlorophos TaxID=658473 RepID=A0ABQ0KWT4_MYCCL|nr:predicted protein [Mycena chlorophos]GAT60475.1 predicted protein [Mycena chlorophos]
MPSPSTNADQPPHRYTQPQPQAPDRRPLQLRHRPRRTPPPHPPRSHSRLRQAQARRAEHQRRPPCSRPRATSSHPASGFKPPTTAKPSSTEHRATATENRAPATETHNRTPPATRHLASPRHPASALSIPSAVHHRLCNGRRIRWMGTGQMDGWVAVSCPLVVSQQHTCYPRRVISTFGRQRGAYPQSAAVGPWGGLAWV